MPSSAAALALRCVESVASEASTGAPATALLRTLSAGYYMGAVMLRLPLVAAPVGIAGGGSRASGGEKGAGSSSIGTPGGPTPTAATTSTTPGGPTTPQGTPASAATASSGPAVPSSLMVAAGLDGSSVYVRSGSGVARVNRADGRVLAFRAHDCNGRGGIACAYGKVWLFRFTSSSGAAWEALEATTLRRLTHGTLQGVAEDATVACDGTRLFVVQAAGHDIQVLSFLFEELRSACMRACMGVWVCTCCNSW